jgi:hypothetical protein
VHIKLLHRGQHIPEGVLQLTVQALPQGQAVATGLILQAATGHPVRQGPLPATGRPDPVTAPPGPATVLQDPYPGLPAPSAVVQAESADHRAVQGLRVFQALLAEGVKLRTEHNDFFSKNRF